MEGRQMHKSKCIGQQWVHGTIYPLDLRCVRRLRPQNLSMSRKQGVAVGVEVDVGFQVAFPLPLGI